MSMFDKYRKKIIGKEEWNGETIRVRALNIGELNLIESIPKSKQNFFVIGCGLLNDREEQAFTAATTDELLALAEKELADVPFPTIQFILQLITKTGKLANPETLAKN